jgi:hypothetical protein
MLILSVFAIGMVVAWHSVPESSQRILDTLTGGLIGAMTLATQKSIDGARAVADAATIKDQAAQLGAAMPPSDGPSGRADDPVHVEAQ